MMTVNFTNVDSVVFYPVRPGKPNFGFERAEIRMNDGGVYHVELAATPEPFANLGDNMFIAPSTDSGEE